MKRFSVCILCLALALWAGLAVTGGLAAEHPAQAGAAMPTASDIRSAILAHIESETVANNGTFRIADSETREELSLHFDKLHDDKVANILKGSGQGASFACTDFTAPDGTRYDLDFWMRPDASGRLGVVDTKIHKVNGEPRFTYENDEIVEIP